MGVKRDYNANRVSDLGRLINGLVDPSSDIDYIIPENRELTVEDKLYNELMKLLAEGHINEAENILDDAFEDSRYTMAKLFRVGISFYMQANELSEETLENNRYSREEIAEGIQSLGARYGIELPTW